MKRILLLTTLILLIFNPLYSQQELLWQNEFLSKAEKITFSDFDNTWIVAGSEKRDPINNWPFGYSYLAKLDTLGNLLWQVTHIGTQEITKVQALNVLDNGKILLSVNWNLCDVNGIDSLYLYASNGYLLKKESGFQSTSDFQPLNNKDFIVANYGKIQCVDTNLNVVWTYDSGTFYNRTILKQAPNGNIFAFMEDSILNLHSTTGMLTNHYVTNMAQEGVAQSGEFFHTIDENQTVFLMDTAFNFGFATFDVADYFDEVYKAAIHPSSSNQLYVLGKKNSSSTFIVFSNGIFPMNTFALDTNYQFLSDFTFGNNQVAVVGGDFSETDFQYYQPYYPLWDINTGSAHSFFKTTDFSLSSFNSGVDIGITKIEFDALNFSSGNCVNNGYFSYDFQNVKVTVHNFGTVPIQEFNVYARFGNVCSFICVNTIQIKHLASVNTLHPNDSAVIHLGNINIPQQSSSGILDLCFWTEEAANKIDIHHNNDKFCETIQITNTLDLDNDAIIKVFPNPVMNTLQVENLDNEQIVNLQIFNISGQLIHSQMNTTSSQLHSIDVHFLQSGFYILKMTTENNSTITGKFIKQ